MPGTGRPTCEWYRFCNNYLICQFLKTDKNPIWKVTTTQLLTIQFTRWPIDYRRHRHNDVNTGKVMALSVGARGENGCENCFRAYCQNWMCMQINQQDNVSYQESQDTLVLLKRLFISTRVSLDSVSSKKVF